MERKRGGRFRGFCLAGFCCMLLMASGAAGQTGSCVPSPEGAISWWSFDEVGSSTLQDRTGAHPGALVDGATVGDGLVRGALDLNGLDDHAVVGDSDDWAFGDGDFTVEFWVLFHRIPRGTTSHPGAIFLGNDEGPFLVNKWFFAFGGGLLEFVFSSPSIRDHFLIFSPFSPEPDRWYYLAVRREADTFSAFVDGVLVGVVVDPASIPNPVAPLTIGQAENLGFFDGMMDELAIYSRALTVDEIRSIFLAGSEGKCVRLEIRPQFGGDAGLVSVRITGSEFEVGTTVRLVRDGEPDIVGDPVVLLDQGTGLRATFDLTGRTRGPWDVVIESPTGSVLRIPEGFTVEQAKAAEPWVQVVGLGLIRPERPQTYTVFVGNRGNVDAHLARIDHAR